MHQYLPLLIAIGISFGLSGCKEEKSRYNEAAVAANKDYAEKQAKMIGEDYLKKHSVPTTLGTVDEKGKTSISLEKPTPLNQSSKD